MARSKIGAGMDEIERRATEVLVGLPEWIWDGSSLPLPVETIADSYFGLLVRDVDDLGSAPGAPKVGVGESLSGLLDPARREIWVNAEEARQWPARRRFTIGHELGHFLLHSREKAVMCRHASVDPDDGEATDRLATSSGIVDHRKGRTIPLPEAEANAFAAALLMPAPLIKRFYESTGRDFHKLCELFDCSGAAMGKRLHAVIR